MKKICILFLLVLISQIGFTQTVGFSTLRQVFNYAVGDSFEYRYTNGGLYNIGSSSGQYSCGGNILIVISDLWINGDTLTYGYTYVMQSAYSEGVCDYLFGSGSGTVATPFRLLISNNEVYETLSDFSIFAPDSLTSSLYGSCLSPQQCSDTTFRDSTYNYLKQNQYTDNNLSNAYQTLTDSLGATYIYSFAEDTWDSYELQLIWYHKVNGWQWGAPVNLVPTGINGIKQNTISAKIFPNPSSGVFNLQLSGSYNSEIGFGLFDASGRLVYQQKIITNLSQIDLEGFGKGLYFWQLQNGASISCRGKLVLE